MSILQERRALIVLIMPHFLRNKDYGRETRQAAEAGRVPGMSMAVLHVCGVAAVIGVS